MFLQRVLEMLLQYHYSITKSYNILKAFDIIDNGALYYDKEQIAYEEVYTITVCSRTVIPIRYFPKHC